MSFSNGCLVHLLYVKISCAFVHTAHRSLLPFRFWCQITAAGRGSGIPNWMKQCTEQLWRLYDNVIGNGGANLGYGVSTKLEHSLVFVTCKLLNIG